MVFGNDYEDEGDERNFGRGEKRDDGEQPVSVPAAVERLERGARVRVSRDSISVVDQTPVSNEGAAESQDVATTEEEKDRSTTGVTVKTEVREGPDGKREDVAGVSTRSGDSHAMNGYDSEYYDAQEAETTDADAEVFVAKEKAAVGGEVTEVARSVEAAEEVGTVCEVARIVGGESVEDEEEEFWDAVESVDMIKELKDKDEDVSFPRIRFAPRLGAAPPLKFAL
ncbi:hypothetical protein JG687_00013762 [Phytophthora cactorum]|uniref:Uncharacterized protein n=1 Tax=Phytophthora cactorum TaxID=29920 RepID=A0A8T1TY18_9STRA|nr:hypothetical protein JG687_00013762 [Phytophthora cactorum]